MKKIKTYKSLSLVGCFLMFGTLSSCSDFLTVHPTNQIIEEEYWEDKTDLNNAVAGCYRQEIQANVIQRMIYWGECRSDNFDLQTQTWTDMRDYMNANLLATNDIVKWADFYKAIGYCNNVLKHGPDIVSKDPSFSEEDWKPIEAEMKALRALNYFYLVRSFRDVPFSTEAISEDRQALSAKKRQTPAEDILSFLINDLDSVKDNGMLNYSTTQYNKGHFSKWSIYTLLADLYLWRASKDASPDSVAKYPDKTGEGYASQSARDYSKVIECCDVVLNHMLEEYEKNHSGFGQIREDDEHNPYHLTTLEYEGMTEDVEDNVYQTVFSSTNSEEGIFELQFDGSRNVNTAMTYLYNNNSNQNNWSGRLQASSVISSLSEEGEMDNTSGIYSQTDIRMWESVAYTGQGQVSYPISKYIAGTITFNDLEDMNEGAVMVKKTTRGDANWIIYRLSDVLLMKAEALNYLYDDEEHRQQAFDLVTQVLYRANPSVTDETKRLQFEDYNSRSDMGALIMRERRREFFGEGKRWFDLVRMAEREGSVRTVVSMLSGKYSSNGGATARMSTMNALYNPVHEDEIKVNPQLYQNPAWAKEETISRN